MSITTPGDAEKITSAAVQEPFKNQFEFLGKWISLSGGIPLYKKDQMVWDNTERQYYVKKNSLANNDTLPSLNTGDWEEFRSYLISNDLTGDLSKKAFGAEYAQHLLIETLSLYNNDTSENQNSNQIHFDENGTVDGVLNGFSNEDYDLGYSLETNGGKTSNVETVFQVNSLTPVNEHVFKDVYVNESSTLSALHYVSSIVKNTNKKDFLSNPSSLPPGNWLSYVNSLGGSFYTKLSVGPNTYSPKASINQNGQIDGESLILNGDIDAEDCTLSGNFSAQDCTLSGVLNGTDADFDGEVKASSINCARIGQGSVALSTKSIAIGDSALSSHENCVSLGYNAKATSSSSLALGAGAQASASLGCAIGFASVSSSSNLMVLGVSATTVKLGNGSAVTSDLRDKTDVEDNDLGLEFLLKLETKKYKKNDRDRYWLKDKDGNFIHDEENPKYRKYDEEAHRKAEKKGSRYHLGLISQELKKIIDPEKFRGFVDFNHNDRKSGELVKEKYEELGINYGEFIPVAIKAIQELHDIHKKEISLFEKQNEEIFKRLELLENR